MKKASWIILLLNCCVFALDAQTINTVKLDSFLNILSSKGLAMGSLAISKNGIMQYQKAMGYASIAGDKRKFADTHTKYRVGSATKMFTAVMIFQLAEEKKIKLEDTLKTYFPDLPNAGKITLQQMLYHRSGLHDYTHDTNFPDWMNQPKSHAELLEIIKKKGSDFEPGTDADYSNSNYLILGYIIEKICKMPYADALKKRIITPLHLKHTYYGKPVNINDHESYSYKYSGKTWSKEKQTDLRIHGGAGAIVSTPADMVIFANALFTNKLVSKASLAKMETLVDDYGMGMFPNKYGDKPSFGHNGRIEEFYSALWYFPSEKLCFAYCTNGINYPRTDIIEGILKICFNEPFVLPFAKRLVVNNKDWDKYTGTYSSGPIVVTCTKSDTALLLETKGKVFTATMINNNYFMNAESGYFFEFVPDKGELLIKETDNMYRLKK